MKTETTIQEDTVTDYRDEVIAASSAILLNDGRYDGQYCDGEDAISCKVDGLHYHLPPDHEPDTDNDCCHHIAMTTNGDVIPLRDITQIACGDWYETDECVWIERCCEYAHEHDDEVVPTYNGEEYNYRSNCWWIESRDTYVNDGDEDYAYCDRTEEYRHIDDIDDNTSDSPDHINEYHSSPSVHIYDHPKNTQDKYECIKHWTVGFEVEKTTVDGEDSEGAYVGEQPLFAGWETDSSCGVEGITHAYPLTEWGYKLFVDHVRRSSYTDEPSDQRCGGHVNLVNNKRLSMNDGGIRFEVLAGMTLEQFHPYAGLIYAIYRKRLHRSYTACNKKMCPDNNTKYAPFYLKSGRMVECRLPRRVEHGGNLINRFKLFRELAYAVENKLTFKGFMRRTRDVLRDMYPSPTKREHIRRYAYLFNDYILNDVVHPDIKEFIENQ
jgi:hypothetical protein